MKDIQSVTVAGPALKEDSIECYTSIKKNSQASEKQQRGTSEPLSADRTIFKN
jgi:hypothetical protein